MKVVLLNKTDVGGGAAVAANRLNRALRRNGVESNLLVQDLVRSSDGVVGVDQGFVHRQKAFGRFVGERLAFLPHEKDSSIRFAFSPANTGLDISEHPMIKEADIIHLHWINQGFLSIESMGKLFELGKPIVWTQHDMWAFTGGCHYSGSCQQFLEMCCFCPFLKKPSKHDLSYKRFMAKKEVYDHTTMAVVACSKWLRGLAKESKLFRYKDAYAIPNPIDTNFYRPLDKTEQRDKLGLPKGKRLILFGSANVNDPRKGMIYFLEALNILHNKMDHVEEQVELLVFGKMKENLSQQLPFKIHAFNFVKDPNTLLSLYNAADAFVLPSLQDNLPNTVMESLACGTPVVGFGIGGVPEMVQHKESGYMAEVKNAMSLADGLYHSLFEADLNAYSKAARTKVETCYAEDVVAKQYVEVYQSLLSK